jgi:hypothetical protein
MSNNRLRFIFSVLVYSALLPGNLLASQFLVEQSRAAVLFEQDTLRAKANNARYLTIDSNILSNLQSDPNKRVSLYLPTENNDLALFKLTPAPVFSAALAAKYPHLMTYTGYQVDKPQNSGRFSISPKGFFGFYEVNNVRMLLSPQLMKASPHYIFYQYDDALAISDTAETINKLLLNDIVDYETQQGDEDLAFKPEATGDQIRTYRLVLSATAEYTQFNGGTVADVVAENVTLINRVNQILLTDLALQFELVDNESVIFTDANTDPFTNSDATSDIEANQSTIDSLIGAANYDIGHLLSTSPGGLAGVGVMCINNRKARGTTGARKPTGERFYIDLFAHEIGHQLGARHSFNASNNSVCDSAARNSESAFEPGSGTTIMSYAGLCSGQSPQNNSSPYFHAGSIEQIRARIDTGPGGSCGMLTDQDNGVPQIELEDSTYTIPTNTPFVLNASAFDSDEDTLSYNWEQLDSGGPDGGTADTVAMRSDNGFNPLFRSYPASAASERYFPQLKDVLSETLTLGETYATTERDLTFRLSVRDNKGGVDSADVNVSVVKRSEQFEFIAPDSALVWQGNSEQQIRWAVAQTDEAPVNCLTVDILLSHETNPNFIRVVETAVLNDGEHTLRVPNIQSDSVRLMLKCSDNIFFAVNNTELTILSSTPTKPIISGQVEITMTEDSERVITLDDLVIDDRESLYPNGLDLFIEAGDNYVLQENTLSPINNFNGQLEVNVSITDDELVSDAFSLQISVTAVNDAPIALGDNITLEENADVSLLNVLSNDSDLDGDPLSLVSIEYSGQGTASISEQLISYKPAINFSGTDTINYTVTDGQLTASATLTITVTALPEPTPAPVVTPPPTSGSSGGSFSYVMLCVLAGFVISTHGRRLRNKYNVQCHF